MSFIKPNTKIFTSINFLRIPTLHCFSFVDIGVPTVQLFGNWKEYKNSKSYKIRTCKNRFLCYATYYIL